MIYFALTRSGADALAADGRPQAEALWVNSGIFSDAELAEQRACGVSITVFTSPLDIQDSQEIQSALETIRLHHPGRVIWMETLCEE